MALRNGDDYTPAEGIVRISRHPRRHDISNEKHLKNTDMLPTIEPDIPQSPNNTRQFTLLKDENRRLRKEVELLQRRIAQQRETDMRLEQEIDTIHHGHQLELEQYQDSLREMMEELNQKRDTLEESERKYQELYHSFHEAVDEETRKLLAETAKTMKLSPGYTPPILQDLMQTLEAQLKQTGDQHLAQAMMLARQALRKNEQLEHTLAHEREDNAREHQRILMQQKNIRQQSIERRKYVEASLRARFTGLVTLISTVTLVIAVFLQVILIDFFQIPLYLALISPILFCALVAFGLSRYGTRPVMVKGKPAQAQQPKKAS
jgi:hypothetical protein